MPPTERPTLPSTMLSAQALERVANNHASTVQEVADAVAREDVVVVGMAQNPHVKKARNLLKKAGVAFTYLEYGSYLSGWQRRLAIKLWSGWPTFPQVFVRGVLVGGAADLAACIQSGELQRRLDGEEPAAE